MFVVKFEDLSFVFTKEQNDFACDSAAYQAKLHGNKKGKTNSDQKENPQQCFSGFCGH